MKKYFFVIVLALSTAFITLSADAEGIILCPAINDIKVDIQQQTATAKGGWKGSTIIQRKHQYDWRKMAILIQAFRPSPEAECDFYISSEDGGLYSISLKRPVPDYYLLYTLVSIYPVDTCFDDAAYPYHCYYHDDHI